MKTFEQLTDQQKDKARQKAAECLLEAIIEGAIRFNDELNRDDLQARIDAAIQKAEDMRTPWFAHEYIMDTCADDINGMAECDAMDAYYLEQGERCVYAVA
jgi:hypothetical protein